MLIAHDDPRLVAIRAALLHAVPDLTGHQINSAAMHALIAMDKLASKAAVQNTDLPRIMPNS